jgi:hypothetical protein
MGIGSGGRRALQRIGKGTNTARRRALQRIGKGTNTATAADTTVNWERNEYGNSPAPWFIRRSFGFASSAMGRRCLRVRHPSRGLGDARRRAVDRGVLGRAFLSRSVCSWLCWLSSAWTRASTSVGERIGTSPTGPSASRSSGHGGHQLRVPAADSEASAFSLTTAACWCGQVAPAT